MGVIRLRMDKEPTKDRKNLRSYCWEMSEKMDPDEPTTWPLVLANLTFQVFTRYLSMFKKTVKRKNKNASSSDNLTMKNEEVTIRLSDTKCIFF